MCSRVAMSRDSRVHVRFFYFRMKFSLDQVISQYKVRNKSMKKCLVLASWMAWFWILVGWTCPINQNTCSFGAILPVISLLRSTTRISNAWSYHRRIDKLCRLCVVWNCSWKMQLICTSAEWWLGRVITSVLGSASFGSWCNNCPFLVYIMHRHVCVSHTNFQISWF